MSNKNKKFIDYTNKKINETTPGSWIEQNNNKIQSENDLLFNKNNEIPLHNDNNIFERYNITEKINNSKEIDLSRSSINTRLDNTSFRKSRESIIQNRFQYLNKNFQDPNHLILPFARGGETTRSKDDNETNTLVRNKEFKFKY